MQRGSNGTEEVASLVSATDDDVRLGNSRQSTGGTSIDGMDLEKWHSLQECLRKIRCFKSEAKEATHREQSLVQQLYEARTHIIKKEQEVCDLQNQLARELMERQGLFHEVVKRDKEIFCLQESRAGSNAPGSDACVESLVSTSAAESSSGSNTGSSNVARGDSAANLHSNIFPTHGPILPVLPNQDVTVSPQTTTRGCWNLHKPLTQTNVQWMAATAPSTPSSSVRNIPANRAAQVSPRVQCNLNAREAPIARAVPPWARPSAQAMAEDAVTDVNQVMQSLQIRAASRPMMQTQSGPAPFLP